MTARYYISTGAKSNFYTLRHSFEECTRDGAITRDYHVRNLSTDKVEAVAKARALGFDLGANFEVLPIVRRAEVDWSVLQGGKYAGQSIHEVREHDAGYLVWLCENCADSRAYAKTVDLAKSLVASELEGRQADRDAEEAERLALAKAFAPIASIFDREYPQHVQTGYHQWEYVGECRNSFIDGVVAELRQGRKISMRAAEIIIEKVAKLSGRRNSKAYAKAYDHLLEITQPAIKA
jgi:hypothetical protein